MNYDQIKKPTLGRLPLYYEYVNSLPEGVKHVSSAEMAKALGLGEVQVRKDLGSISKKGKPKIGFSRADLVKSFEQILKPDGSNCVVIGAGKLGKAFLGYDGFKKFGLDISAAFDVDPLKCGLGEGKPVYNLTELGEYCKTHAVKIGVITVPAFAAQNACDALVSAGVKTIWCFAPVKLRVDDDVTVLQEDMALSLAFLNLKIKKD